MTEAEVFFDNYMNSVDLEKLMCNAFNSKYYLEMHVMKENICKKYNDGFCKTSCGPGINVEVKATMATESCPWIWHRW